MTNRERIDAVIRGDEVDRYPVWLKMANGTWKSSQPEPYKSMDSVELLRAAGCDVMVGCGMPPDALTTRRPHVTIRDEQTNGTRRTIVETPDGPITGEEAFDPYTTSWHPCKFCAASLEDFRKLRWMFVDTGYTVDAAKAQEGLERKKQMVADDIYTNAGCGPSPLMHLVEHMCGPEACCYHMYDEPELFAEVLQVMHEDRVRFLKAILPHCPADTFWLTENTSTTLISPRMFRDYCMPHLEVYGRLVLENGLIPVHHMCGTLNALLEMIDTLPAFANEAFTTRPVGDCSLTEGRTRMPSKALIGGTNATLWLAPAEKIVEEVAQDLAACPDRRKIFLTSAGVLPPPVSFEKAKKVVEGLKSLGT
jgi:uroporphyrinogen-III decarboxylase